MPERPSGSTADEVLIRVDVAATALLVLTSLAAAALPTGFERVHAVVSGLLFSLGTGALLWAYLIGISRSRRDLVTLSGLFFLGGESAPGAVRRRFQVALAVQVVAVVTAAAIRPYSEAAFGVLAPMFGLGLMALWGGRHGSFSAKDPPSAGPPD
ncbi:MAG: hypothetical protein ACT4OV_15890 [Microthrixaceae bacterium]